MVRGQLVTIQLGGYANHVGAHFWNLQDEAFSVESPTYDSSVLYRVGETPKGDASYVPRVVTLDFRGHLGSDIREGALYGLAPAQQRAEAGDASLWAGGMHVIAQNPVNHSEYIQSLWDEEMENSDRGDKDEEDEQENEEVRRLEEKGDQEDHMPQDDKHDEESAPDETPPEAQTNEEKKTMHASEIERGARFWTDYCKSFFHARSHIELNTMQRFDCFPLGEEALRTMDQGEELLDQIRWFAEECDTLQGFVIPADFDAGFGACAKHVLTEISDFYPRTSSTVFALSPPSLAAPTPIYDINTAMGVVMLSELSSVFAPIPVQTWGSAQFSGLTLDTNSKFQTAAVAASAIDCITLPWRMIGPSAMSTSQVIANLVKRPMLRATTLEAALPLPNADTFARGEAGHVTNLSWPGAPPQAAVFGEHVVIRGVPQDQKDALESYLVPCRARTALVWREPMRVPVPYPQFFSEPSQMIGMPADGEAAEVVTLLPMLARMQSSHATQVYLKQVQRRFDFEMQHRTSVYNFVATGIEQDELQEIQEQLVNIVEEYDFN